MESEPLDLMEEWHRVSMDGLMEHVTRHIVVHFCFLEVNTFTAEEILINPF